MWLYRRMLGISWKGHKTNEEVLNKMKTKKSLLNTIKKRKCQYCNDVVQGLQRYVWSLSKVDDRYGLHDK